MNINVHYSDIRMFLFSFECLVKMVNKMSNGRVTKHIEYTIHSITVSCIMSEWRLNNTKLFCDWNVIYFDRISSTSYNRKYYSISETRHYSVSYLNNLFFVSGFVFFFSVLLQESNYSHDRKTKFITHMITYHI